MSRVARSLRAIIAGGSIALVGACDVQSRGFALPAGDADRGRAAFVSLGCRDCHSVSGESTLGVLDPDAEIQVALGGSVTRIKTYGDLVTSIINPSHRLAGGEQEMTTNPDGTSRMRLYNDVMTVQQLVDLVTFLEGRYEVWVPPTDYPPMF